jgi:serine/threonine protein kinase
MGEETKTLTKFVTPGYAPFEQYYGKSDMQGPWTDIYSLGATLYRAITGDPPIDSTFRNRSTGEKAILEIWDILDKHNSKYSTFFLRAIEHSLRSNFKDRPQSVSEWKVMFTDPSVSTQTQWRLASSSSGKSVFTEPIQLQGMRNRNLLIISVTVVLLLVALIIYLLIN